MSKKSDVADLVESWIKKPVTMTWMAWSAKTDSTLLEAYGDKSWGKLPDPSKSVVCCCWEMPIYAAIKQGALKTADAPKVFDNIAKGGFMKADPLLSGKRTAFDAKKPPQRGDLVFFAADTIELAHAVIASGEAADGDIEVYSLWSVQSATGPVEARIQRNTIKGLSQVIKLAFKKDPKVFYGTPIWG